MPKPIFIVGSGRSGTSVLTWAIGQHPNIIVTPEINWVSTLASHLEGLYGVGISAGDKGQLATWNVSRAAFFRGMGDGIDHVIRASFEARFPERRGTAATMQGESALRWYNSPGDPKARWVDGTPSNVGYAGILAEMFPEAKFINLLRKPDDVLRSWLGISWRDKRHSAAGAVLKHIHRSTEAGLMTHAALGDDRVMRVIFEDLVFRPEATMRAIMSFLGEEYVPESTGPILGGKMNATGPIGEGSEREYRSLINGWRLREMRAWYAAAQDPSWRIAAPDLAQRELLLNARQLLPLDGMLALPRREQITRQLLYALRPFSRRRTKSST